MPPTPASRRILIHTAALAAAAPAAAQLSVIRFDTSPRGQVVTNQLQDQGLLVSGTAPSGLLPGEILDITLGDRGVFDFGGSRPQAMLYGIVGDRLILRLVSPQGAPVTHDFAALRIGDGDPQHESFRVSFFDLAGTLLSSQDFTTTGGPAGGGVTAWFEGQGNIHRIEVLGIGTASGGAVDDLEFGTLAPCDADCWFVDYPRVLDIFDFLCFQNLYAAMDPYACDCDTQTGPLVCDIFDFLCFQNAYDAGCP